MNVSKTLLIIGLCLMVLGASIKLLVNSTQTATHNQFKENSKSFAIDSVQYHPAGKDNTLQVTPYWMCHLKGTNHWVRVTENKKVGDSLPMIIR